LLLRTDERWQVRKNITKRNRVALQRMFKKRRTAANKRIEEGGIRKRICPVEKGRKSGGPQRAKFGEREKGMGVLLEEVNPAHPKLRPAFRSASVH